MSTRTTARILRSVMVAMIVASCGVPSPTTSVTTTTSLPATSSTTVPQSPLITVEGATGVQLQRLDQALDRFARARLELPPLHVVFSTEAAACNDHHGLFSTGFDPWRIAICSSMTTVYEHELAHAWAQTALNESRRQAFMELRGYQVWTGPDTPWNQRGMEGVAVVIQQGLSGLPLPPVLGREMRGRLQGFELLTGYPDPRLVDWLEEREVACGDRPTILARMITDGQGRICPPSTQMTIPHTRFVRLG